MTQPSKTGQKPDPNAGRNDRGQFRPGNRANPRGRPNGSRNRASLLLDRLAESDAEAILQTVLDAARGGDLKAAEIVLSRVWPARKGRPVRLALPPLTSVQDVPGAMAALLAAAAEGTLTPDEAGALASVVDACRKAHELVDIERRLAALEAQEGHSP